METTPKMSSTIEEASVFAVALCAGRITFDADTAEEALGASLNDTLAALIAATALIGPADVDTLEQRLHRNEDPVLRLGASLFRLIEAIRDVLDADGPQRTRQRPSIQEPFVRDLVGAAVRAVDRKALDRGFEVDSAELAWDLVAFSIRAVYEQVPSMLLDRRRALEEAELCALDALTATILVLVSTRQ